MDEYRRAAGIYDALVGPFLKPVHTAIVSSLSSAGSQTVVDLCCGTGLLAGMIGDTGKNVVGVDISPAMLSVGRKHHPGVTFIDGDASSLPFSESKFDAATISFGLHEKSESIAMAILSEARRVVAPEGLILVADYRLPPAAKPKWVAAAITLVERMAGRDHFDHFTQYMHAGGTEMFLQRAGLTCSAVNIHMYGWAGVYVAR